MLKQYHKTETMNIEDIKPDTTNPNKMTTLELQSLEYSFKKFGDTQPIIIDANTNIIASGHNRLAIYKKNGHKQVDVIKYPFKNDKERRLFLQMSNKLHGSHDPRLDASFLFDLVEKDQNSMIELMKLTAKEDERVISNLIKKYRSDFESSNNKDEEELDSVVDIDPSKIKKQVVQTGDIWILGNHKLLCADFADNELMNKLTEDKKMDMIFVDPPYNIMGSSNGFSKMDDDNIIQPFFRSLLQIIKNNTKPNGHIYICCNWRSYYPIIKANSEIDLTPKNLIVWHKPNTRLGSMYSNSHEFILFLSNEPRDKRLNSIYEKGKKVRTVCGETNVWVYNTDQTTVREHYAQKPIILPSRAIKNSTDDKELVMDMCMGSGTTLIAAEELNRVCYGVEINPKYCQVIIEKWQLFTGKQAYRQTDKILYNDLLNNE